MSMWKYKHGVECDFSSVLDLFWTNIILFWFSQPGQVRQDMYIT